MNRWVCQQCECVINIVNFQLLAPWQQRGLEAERPRTHAQASHWMTNQRRVGDVDKPNNSHFLAFAQSKQEQHSMTEWLLDSFFNLPPLPTCPGTQATTHWLGFQEPKWFGAQELEKRHKESFLPAQICDYGIGFATSKNVTMSNFSLGSQSNC